ncbi:hypothetical protein OQA88_9339 [Cercophora sp. LCS_1]
MDVAQMCNAAPEAESPTTRTDAEAPAPVASEAGVSLAQDRIQPEEPYDEGDEDPYGTDDTDDGSTASLSESILNYRTLHGRSYHSNRGDAEYWGPLDEPQNEALDIIHHVLTLLLDGELCKAPIGDNVQKVLDVGTGTGLWAIDFADKYPSAEVIGTDLSPIQPTWIPPNLSFQIDDCTQEWTFPENTFDFIHIRWLFGSIKDWEALYREAYRSLKPGGWIESHEASTQFRSDDGSVNEKTAMGQFGRFFAEGGAKMGRSMTIVEDGVQCKGIEAAGFVNIQEQNFKSPLGSWPSDPKLKEMGNYQHLATANDLAGTMLYLGSLTGWSPDEIQVYAANLRREFRSSKVHGYYLQKIVWAQKPR